MSCRYVIPCAPPKRPLPWIRLARVASTSALDGAVSQGLCGYGIPYEESRERFQESLEVILKAWTQERFSHAGKYFTCNDLSIVPRPYQKPYPPIWVAATTQDTFPMVGRMGFALVTGLRVSTSHRSS